MRETADVGTSVEEEMLELILELTRVTVELEDVAMELEDSSTELEGAMTELEDTATELGRLRPKEEPTLLLTSPMVLLPRVPFQITGQPAASRSRLPGTQLHI